MNKDFFLKSSNLASLPLWRQILINPFRFIPFFTLSKIMRFLRLQIKLRAKTFFGDYLEGIVPDPTFSFIYLYGFSDEGLTQMIMRTLKKGETFIDVGAHIGYETLLGSKIVSKNGRVISFEPTPDTYAILYRNTINNSNVIINNFAVWSKSKFLKFFDYGGDYSGLNGVSAPRAGEKTARRLKSHQIVVPGISLDEYCEIYNIKPNLVKIDAESAEYDILHGMKHIIANIKPKIIFEIGDMPNEIGKTKKCISFLEGYGYTAFEYRDKHIIPHFLRNEYFGLYDNILFLPQK